MKPVRGRADDTFLTDQVKESLPGDKNHKPVYKIWSDCGGR